MKPTTSAQLIEALEWRYAVKLFDPSRKIAGPDWSALERALVLTPSSYGLQPWKFLVVRDDAIRAKLRAASWNQGQVTDCSHFVVFLQLRKMSEEYVDAYMQSISSARGTPLEKLAGFRKNIIENLVNAPRAAQAPEWAARQVYIALGNFMTAAALIGVDACPMEGLDAAKYDEILGLEQSPYRTLVACAAGYRDANDKLGQARKVRFPESQIIERI